MLHILTRLFGAIRPAVVPAATGFPVLPVFGSWARRGEDVAGPALIGAFESDGLIDRVSFFGDSVVLHVVAWELAGVYATHQAVFAWMLEVRGGIDGVLGAAVRVRDTGNDLELMFCAAPVGSADRRAHASRAPWPPQRAGRSRGPQQRAV